MAPPRKPLELVRLPPDDPACLVRASLVCKPWRRILADPGFLRRYVATSPFPKQLALGRGHWRALDCRHGRVLLDYRWDTEASLVVWDPITGEQHRPRMPNIHKTSTYYWGAVLCAMAGCDHLSCQDGPFLVVYVGVSWSGTINACAYSLKVREWSVPVSVVHISTDIHIDQQRGVLCGDDMYFTVGSGANILKFDLGKHCLSLIDSPYMHPHCGILIVTRNNSLGLASIRGSSLYLWSREVKQEGDAEWIECRVIELAKLVPLDNLCNRAILICFVEGVNVIVLSTDVGVFTIEINSERLRRVSEARKYYDVLPFMSFYTPGSATSKLSLLAEAH
ncbi:hypothetical protein ACP70R_015209 [Stipagrostis hirtigluma subsp. patula]